jgi:hypothetical protein
MPDKEDTSQGMSVERKIVVAVAIILVGILLVAAADYFELVDVFVLKPPYTVPDTVSVVNVFISLILTYFLVTLYNQQSSILDTQTEIQESEQKPILRVDRLDTTEDDLFGYELVVSNVGKGVALNIKLEIEPVLDPELEIKAKNSEWRLHRKEEFASGLLLTNTNYLKPGESRITCKARHELYIWDGEGELSSAVPFENATEKLDKYDVEFQQMKMTLLYEDNLGNEFSEEIADIVFPVKGKTGFLRALEHSTSYEEYDERPQVAERKREALAGDSGVESDSDADTEQ